MYFFRSYAGISHFFGVIVEYFGVFKGLLGNSFSFHSRVTVDFSVLCVPSAITLENPKIRPNFRKKPEKGLKTSGLILE